MYDILIKLQTGKLRRLPPGSKWVGTPSPGPPFLRSGLKERFFSVETHVIGPER